MSISKIMSNEPVINNAQVGTMQKTESAPETTTAPVIAGKEALDNPAETIGRSMVNFQGRRVLSPQDLNKLADSGIMEKMSGDEIKVGKKVVMDLMKQYKCSSLSDLSKFYKAHNMDAGDLALDVMSASAKYDSKVNLDKICEFIGSAL